MCTLHGFVFLLEGPGQTECKHHPDKLEEPDADADTADDGDVALDLVAEAGEAALRVDLHGSVGVVLCEYAVAAARDVGEAAGVRHVALLGEGRVRPVPKLLCSTAADLSLDNVPGLGDSVVAGLVVVLHALLHVHLYQIVHLVLEPVGCDAGPDLHEEDDAQQHGKGQGHARILLDGSAAPEESDEEDDAADHDEEDGRVEEVVAQEVQVLTVGSLNDSTGYNQHQTGKRE